MTHLGNHYWQRCHGSLTAVSDYKALEVRQRDFEIFNGKECEPLCDIRVFARDVERHPVVYLCTKSQKVPLHMLRKQFILTFEKACRLTLEDGQLVALCYSLNFKIVWWLCCVSGASRLKSDMMTSYRSCGLIWNSETRSCCSKCFFPQFTRDVGHTR